MDLTIRNEKEGDYRAVEEVVREAFWDLYVPGCTEHFIVHNLRRSSDFIPELDFVAEKDGQIVGQIIYSRGVLRDKDVGEKKVISFGPVSVLPAFQKQGIGSSLIMHTINLAREMGFLAICIYGDPRYYSRFGFRCGEKYEVKTADDKYAVALLVLELKQGSLDAGGRFIESDSFNFDPDKFVEYDTSFPYKEKKFETDSQKEFRLLSSLRY
jgi:putative acetyltransferase